MVDDVVVISRRVDELDHRGVGDLLSPSWPSRRAARRRRAGRTRLPPPWEM